MDGMEYENLLSRIYQVDRGEREGVDADYYRRMEQAKTVYDLEVENVKQKRARISSESIDTLAYNYRVQCRKVMRHVENAINTAIQKYQTKFSLKEIADLQNSVREPESITQEYIDHAISVARKILSAHQINY